MLELSTVQPDVGSVAGGTRISIEGGGLAAVERVEIGGIECGSIAIESSSRISCTTGASDYVEGPMDVVAFAERGDRAMLPTGFEYSCPWMTSTGRRTCGAAPPGMVEPQRDASRITQFQAGHGFVANPDGAGASNIDDTTDFVLGTRSAWIETDGAGTARTLTRMSMAAIDMRDHLIKVWVKVDNVASASVLELRLGDAGLANYFRFRLRSNQGQQWMTDGDWVAFTVSWSPDNYVVVGSPDRSAITDVAFRVVDDQTGVRVRLHVNGLGLVPEPIDRFPDGVLSFTFDDNHADMVGVGAEALERHGFPATAYVIIDYLDRPLRATTAQLRDLQREGWDIAAHSMWSTNHDARFPTLAPAVVEDDLVDSRAWLMAHGFRGFDHCAYPGGDFTRNGHDILPIVARYYASCRTIYQRQREAYPPSDPYKLRVLYVTSGTSLATAKAAVSEAKTHREWIILVFHKLVDVPVLATEWSKRDFAELVAHVEATGIPVATVASVLAAP